MNPPDVLPAASDPRTPLEVLRARLWGAQLRVRDAEAAVRGSRVRIGLRFFSTATAAERAELAVEIEHARNLKDAEYWRFSRSSSPRVAPGGPGTVRYGRATRERSRRIAERVAAATAPCHDCDGRGYDCERWPDGTERANATPVACTTCGDAGTLPLSIVMLLARRAA